MPITKHSRWKLKYTLQTEVLVNTLKSREAAIAEITLRKPHPNIALTYVGNWGGTVYIRHPK